MEEYYEPLFFLLSLSLLKYYEAIVSSLHFLVISLIICQHISHQVLCFRPIYFISFLTFLIQLTGFPDGSMGKEYACNVGDMGDVGLIGGFVRSPGEGNSNPLLVWEIPRTEGQGGLQSKGSKSFGHNRATKYIHIQLNNFPPILFQLS